LPVPRVERRSASSAEPAGRRGDTARLSHQATGPKMRAGTPALPGGEPCQSHAWRGARPRARSPQGDGRPGLSPASAQPAPDAGGDARAPRRGALPVPRVERRSASSAEPGGRRETRPITSLRATGPKMRAGTPALPGEGPMRMTARSHAPRKRASGIFIQHSAPKTKRPAEAKPGGVLCESQSAIRRRSSGRRRTTNRCRGCRSA
jgi:hypothetical protein